MISFLDLNYDPIRLQLVLYQDIALIKSLLAIIRDHSLSRRCSFTPHSVTLLSVRENQVKYWQITINNQYSFKVEMCVEESKLTLLKVLAPLCQC